MELERPSMMVGRVTWPSGTAGSVTAGEHWGYLSQGRAQATIDRALVSDGLRTERGLSKVNNILLDVDGVLADFMGAALHAHSANVRLEDWPKGHWGIADVLGISEEDFWKPIDNYDFWVSVPLICGAWEFVDKLAHLAPVTFCTVPSKSAACAAAKITWLRQHFGEKFGSCYMIGGAKHLFAKPGRLLIDDNDMNVQNFRKEEGAAYLFPRVWNQGWKTDETLAKRGESVYNYVYNMVEGICDDFDASRV